MVRSKTDNEDLHRMTTLSSANVVSTSVYMMVAMAFCVQPCSGAATADIVFKGLRGHRHLRQHAAEAPATSETLGAGEEKASFDDMHPMAPLYDDFLDIMNNAAAKALDEQRAVPAYDDFLHLMKHSAEKAYKEQAGAPQYDQFLDFMKGKSDLAIRQQLHLPSYDDFLTALRASSVEALKTPVPSYEDFLGVLKDGAEKAMKKRVRQEKSVNSVDVKTPLESFGTTERGNPLDAVKRKVEEVERGATGRKEKDDEDKLREELRQLKKEQKAHRAAGAGASKKKPLMKRINVLRTQLCWKRPNLWQHEKCLRFLGLHCLQESTGEGICRAFTKKATEKCKSAKEGSHWKEDYCALSEALSDSYGEDEEEEDDDEQDELAEDNDDEETDHEVGSDDDLDDDLDDMDKDLGVGAEAVKGGADEDDIVDDEDGVKDSDGDGVPDDKDAFADDPNEWADTDKDGIGDNADEDIDGDGHNNDVDVFPLDPKEWADSDHDGIGDNADKDRDNDGIENDKDVFPDDPTEWLDSDKDGIGDNKDAYPYNPNCHSHVLPCGNIKKSGTPKPATPQDPTTLDKDAMRPLPDQGFSEHMTGPLVNHNNYYTWVGDWQAEFPEMGASEAQTMSRICREHPTNSWCEKFKHRDAHFR